jgi:alkanesulfonate monooxygenase SsuD/methylene tetrahydromethanopterin reductase-like flavin-dependent oxidoreductase (luciferase family)
VQDRPPRPYEWGHLTQRDKPFGWNVVTSGMNEEAMNFSRDANIEHARRYESAEEFLDITKALWGSIEDDALLLDKKSGFFADPARVHRINHTGKHFKVRGPLNVPRPPPHKSPHFY